MAVDGDTVLVGADWDEDPNGEQAGSAYVYWKEQREVMIDVKPGDDTGPVDPDTGASCPS